MRIQRPIGILASLSICIGGLVGISQPADAASRLVPASFDIVGSGFGHGVGLSQYGARGMALAGYNADQIVKHYYVNTTIGTEKTPTSLRVGLAQDQQYVAVRGESLGGQGGRLTVTIGSTTRTLQVNSAVVFSISGTNARATFADGSASLGPTATIRWNGTTANGSAPSVVNVATSYSATSAKSALGGYCKNTFAGTVVTGFDACPHRYRYGQLEIAAGQFGDSSTDLNVVNTLRLGDEYLYGLGEVPSSWETPALAAQAIAARSYALATYNTTIASPSSVSVAGTKVRSACRCHLYSTIVDQNFVGFNKEYSIQGNRWVAAVKLTIPTANSGMGKVILYQSKVIKAFFSSATGGKSQPIREVWGSTSYPWSTVVADTWALNSKTGNPNITWTRTIKQGELVQALRNIGIQVANVKTFKVTGLYTSGGVSKLTLWDNTAKATTITVGPSGRITPDTLRWVLGVKSTYLRSITANTALVPPPSASPTPKPTPTSTVTKTPTPTPSPTQIRSITNVTWPASTIAPGTYSVSGGLDPRLKNLTVSLKKLVNNNWTTLDTATSGIDGSWILSWDNATLGNHTLAVSVTYSGKTVTTSSATFAVVPTLSIGGNTTAVKQSSIMLQGQLKPATGALTVTIVRKIGNGTWQQVRTARTKANGRWGVMTGVGASSATVSFKALVSDKTLGTVKSSVLRVTVK